MIRAEHRWWAPVLFDPYLRKIFRKDHSHFFISNDFPEIPGNAGLLITPNHISWWDGFYIYYCMKHFSRRKIYLMMLREQLAQFQFFRFMGAYSIDPGHRGEVQESLEYTRDTLLEKNSYTVVYPQGEIIPQDTAPLTFQRGILLVLRKLAVPVYIMPVIFLVKPFNERHPEIWCRFGKPHMSDDVLRDFAGYEQAANRELAELQESVLNRIYASDLFQEKK